MYGFECFLENFSDEGGGVGLKPLLRPASSVRESDGKLDRGVLGMLV